MDLGLSEYLPKPLTRDVVQTQLRPKLLGDAAPDPTERGGHVISICGAQGGVGRDQHRDQSRAATGRDDQGQGRAARPHLQGGEAAVMLGVRPGPGLRIALENPMRADTLFIERAAIEVNERVRLISADEDLDAQARHHRRGRAARSGPAPPAVQLTSSSTCRCRWRRPSIR